MLNKDDSFEILSAITIDLGEVTVRAWRPILSFQEQQRYHKNANQFNKEFLDALPRLPQSITTTGASTLDLRLGLENAVYKREETAKTNTGSFATVMKVKELRSGKIFAAKVPHFRASDRADKARKRWELVEDEFQKIIKLEHVGDFQIQLH